MDNAAVKMIKDVDGHIQERFLQRDAPKKTPLDTFLKWSPFLVLFALEAKGLKTKNGIGQQALNIVAGEIILNAAVFPMKTTIRRMRPNGDNDKSFPSRHTATSFLGSAIMHEELKQASPFLSCSGYVIAIITGTLRIYHNKHWFSDVASGALLGILAARLSKKVIEQFKNKKVIVGEMSSNYPANFTQWKISE